MRCPGGLELIQAAGGLKSGLRFKPEQLGVYYLDDPLRAVTLARRSFMR